MKNSIKYYFDEHIADAIADGLRRRGIDVLTLVEADKLGANDEVLDLLTMKVVSSSHTTTISFVWLQSHLIIRELFLGRRDERLGKWNANLHSLLKL